MQKAQTIFWSLVVLTLIVFGYAISTIHWPYFQKPASASSSPTVLANIDYSETIHISDAVDGDTLHITRANGEKATLRLIGVDTPETIDPRKPVQCFGQIASAFTKFLVTDIDSVMTFDATQQQIDKYNRLLAYITLPDGSDLSEKLLREGYATEYTYEVPYKRQKQYIAAQSLAQTENLGFWSPSGCNGKR